MKVTYIYHSGFAVETDTAVLVFDYYKGKLPNVPTDNKLYYFVSHVHADHYGSCIYDSLSERPDAHYILDSGINHVPAGINATEVIPHGEYNVDGVNIKTLRSTDCGVAYLVTVDGVTIYHAGDLHLWVWQGASAIERRFVEIAFTRELEMLKDITIDAAFLPLDPRQEEDGSLGFDYAMRNLTIKKAFPMHFWEQPEYVRSFVESNTASSYRDRIVPLTNEGDTVTI